VVPFVNVFTTTAFRSCTENISVITKTMSSIARLINDLLRTLLTHIVKDVHTARVELNSTGFVGSA